jgi:2-octaprenyl-6-methoxyphenol hydroxylase
LHIRACGVPPRKFVETFREFGGLKIAPGTSIVLNMSDALQVYDAVIIGGGPAGLTAAIGLADSGARTALLARRAPYADNRTTRCRLVRP